MQTQWLVGGLAIPVHENEFGANFSNMVFKQSRIGETLPHVSIIATQHKHSKGPT